MLLLLTACSLTPILEGRAEGPVLIVESGAEATRLEGEVFHFPSVEDSLDPIDLVSLGVAEPPAVHLPEGADLRIHPPAGWETAVLSSSIDGCLGTIAPDHPGGIVDNLGPAGDRHIFITGRRGEDVAVWQFSLTTDDDRHDPAPFVAVEWSPGRGNLPALTPFLATFSTLQVRPDELRAWIEVEAVGGRTLTVDLIRVHLDESDCLGTPISTEAPMSFTSDVAALGGAPYRLHIKADAGGEITTFGPVVWPDDFPRTAGSQLRIFAED